MTVTRRRLTQKLLTPRRVPFIILVNILTKRVLFSGLFILAIRPSSRGSSRVCWPKPWMRVPWWVPLAPLSSLSKVLTRVVSRGSIQNFVSVILLLSLMRNRRSWLTWCRNVEVRAVRQRPRIIQTELIVRLSFRGVRSWNIRPQTVVSSRNSRTAIRLTLPCRSRRPSMTRRGRSTGPALTCRRR